MQRYRWPGYEMQLLGELQRQQHSAQFCDTLLQTEGISVPSHSCILAALSPYLSEKLSASPSPPSGQKRHLHLHAVKAETLLKLVGLLYSGEVEVKESAERNEVMAAARWFGITHLVEAQKDTGVKEGEAQKKSFLSCRANGEEGGDGSGRRKMQDAQVQAKMAERGATYFSIERRSYVSTGTQTVNEKTLTHPAQTEPPTQEPASSEAQTLDFSISLQPQNIALDEHLCSTSFSGASSNGESTLGRSSDSAVNPTSTSACSSNTMTFPFSLNDDFNCQTPQVDSTYWQSLERKTNGETSDTRLNTDELSHHLNRDETLGDENGNCTEDRLPNIGKKNVADMKQTQQMIETTQISIKVKLRRRTEGEAWEVVSRQDSEEMLSVHASVKQDASNHKRPQADLTNDEPPPSCVQPGSIRKPETLIPGPVANNFPEPQPHPNTASDSQLLSSDYFTPNQNNGLESAPLAHPPGPVEESDEQIEKMLEDIMIGLNILPSLERDCKKSHHLRPNHDGAAAICHVPVIESDGMQGQIHVADGAAGRVYYQDFGTEIDQPSTDTVLNQQQQQQHLSSQYLSSVTSMLQRDGPSHQDMTQISHNCPYPEEPTAFYSSGQKLHYPVSQEDDQTIQEFLPLTNGTQSSHSFSLPCMDDLRLSRCLSPLETSASAAEHQPVCSDSTNRSNKFQTLLPLSGRPWLTENPVLLQYPLSAITHRANKSGSLPQSTNRSCWSKQHEKHLEPRNGTTVKERGTTSAGLQNSGEVNSDPMEGFNCKQNDIKDDVSAPKRSRRTHTSHPQDSANSLLTYNNVKISGRTKSQIKSSVCSVSLSSNNLLAKEREMATSSSNIPNKFVGKPSELSTIMENQREKPRGSERIRTRGILRKTQDAARNTSLEYSSVLKPMVQTAEIVNTPQRRKRGRPRKVKVEDSPPESSRAITEKKSNIVKRELQIDSSWPKEEEGKKAKRRCIRRRRSRSEPKVIQPRNNLNSESTGRPNADNNSDITPTGGRPRKPWTVTLKDFQQLVRRQHSKIRQSKESQGKETRDVEGEVKACGSTCEELTREAEMDIDDTRPQNMDGIEESHVFNVSVDENHNHIFNKSAPEYSRSQRYDANSSARKEPGWFGQVTEFIAEREQLLRSPAEALKPCDAGGMDATQQTSINDEGSSHSDTHPTQEHNMPLDHNFNPKTPDRAGPPLSHSHGFSKSSGCEQDEEEEEEVDVLLYSPDKVPQSAEHETVLNNMDITLEEEDDEEDVNEIDVTGDEAE